MTKNWLITGAGRGFGREFTRAAAQRGDRAAATARDPKALADLVEEFGDHVVALALDVTVDLDMNVAHIIVPRLRGLEPQPCDVGSHTASVAGCDRSGALGHPERRHRRRD